METSGKVAKGTVRTVYCIGREGNVGGVVWFDSINGRNSAERFAGDVFFDLDVPVASSLREVTLLADDAAWSKAYERGGSCRKLVEKRATINGEVIAVTCDGGKLKDADQWSEIGRIAMQRLFDIGSFESALSSLHANGLDAAAALLESNGYIDVEDDISSLPEQGKVYIDAIVSRVPLETSDQDVFGVETLALGNKEVTRKFSGVYTISEVEACLKDMRLVQNALDTALADKEHFRSVA